MCPRHAPCSSRGRMRTRLTLARAAVLATTISGCYGSHGTVPGVDAGTYVGHPDGGMIVVPPDPPPSCGGSDRITVTIDAIGLRPCGPGVYPDSAVYAVEPAPGGTRFRIDTCPDSDDDCRCDVTVFGLPDGVREDIAGSIGPVNVQLGENGVSIEQLVDCEPGPEPIGCVDTLFFAAMDGLLESPPIDPSSLDVRWAEPVCSRDAPELGAGCSATQFQLGVTAWVSGFPGAIGTEQLVTEGDPVVLDGSIASFAPVRTTSQSCPDIRVARTAAWAAWRPALDR